MHKPPTSSRLWDLMENDDSHKLGEYLRDKSGDNDWTWKTIKNCNLYFSSKGKLIAMTFYSGRAMTETKTYILKEK